VILLDTMVVSEFRKARPSAKAVSWLRSRRADELYLSVLTLGEIERGIAKAPESDFRAGLASWLEDTMRRYADRILDVTPEVARRWGRWSAELGHEGADLFIAATAAVHGMTVATRNTRHYARTGVATIDPFV
jgi:predicted nucleic acid-binding protein